MFISCRGMGEEERDDNAGYEKDINLQDTLRYMYVYLVSLAQEISPHVRAALKSYWRPSYSFLVSQTLCPQRSYISICSSLVIALTSDSLDNRRGQGSLYLV